MKDFKRALFIIFNIFYPLLAIFITNKAIELLLKYYIELDKDVVGALVLSLLLITPYAILKWVSFFEENSHKYYFIFQSIFLVLFTFASIAQFEGFDYAINVWGIIFIGISLIDTIADISTSRD